MKGQWNLPLMDVLRLQHHLYVTLHNFVEVFTLPNSAGYCNSPRFRFRFTQRISNAVGLSILLVPTGPSAAQAIELAIYAA